MYLEVNENSYLNLKQFMSIEIFEAHVLFVLPQMHTDKTRFVSLQLKRDGKAITEGAVKKLVAYLEGTGLQGMISGTLDN